MPPFASSQLSRFNDCKAIAHIHRTSAQIEHESFFDMSALLLPFH